MKKFKGKNVYYDSFETKEFKYEGYFASTGSNAGEPHE